MRCAFEFRHSSWLDDEVFNELRAHNVALCIADTAELVTPLVPTTNWGYLRLRREEYDVAALRGWVDRTAAQPWNDVFVFFKHEDAGTGPALARQFHSLFPATP
jgi:uncharacterized protein YecE (DUF72 family)